MTSIRNAALKFFAALGLLLLLAENGDTQTCPPAEIGLSYTTSSGFNVFPVTWEVSSRNIRYELARCSSETNCTIYGGLSNVLTVSADGALFITNLTLSKVVIKVPTTTAGEIQLDGLDIYCNGVLVCSSLEVFARPVFDPQPCQLTTHDTEAELECSARMYPEGKCILATPFAHLWPTTPSDTTNKANQDDYYETTCRYTLPVTTVPEGNHMLGVFFYPNITDGVLKGKDSDPVYLEISDPETQLEPICYRPYSTNVAECECYVTANVYPAASVAWYDVSGQPVPQNMTRASGRGVTLRVPHNPREINPTFKCRAMSSRGGQNKWIIFQPQFNLTTAYTVDFYAEGLNNNTFRRCPNQSTSVMLVCKVQGGNFSAAPKFYISFPDDPNQQPLEITGQLDATGAAYTVRRALPVSGGNMSISCRAENSSSRSVYGEKQLQFRVLEPPRTAPNMTFLGNHTRDQQGAVTYVELGDVFSIYCEVDGGEPVVSNVTVVCGGVSWTTDRPYVTFQNIIATRSFHMTKCTCTAAHESGCYFKKSETEVRVIDPTASAIQSVRLYVEKANPANQLNLCQGRGEAFKVVCQATVSGALPNLDISVYDSQNQTLPTNDKVNVSGNLHQQSFSFTPSSGGNYTLTCRAGHTGTGSSNLEDNITVTVLEPPPTPPVLRINDKTFNGSDNATLTIAREDLLNATCRVEGGHPNVTEIKLDCGFIDVSQQGNKLSQTDISIPKQIGPMQPCVCTAKHDSQCYTQNSRTVILNITTSNIQSVRLYLEKANPANQLNLCQGKGEAFKVVCQATVSGTLPNLNIGVYDSQNQTLPTNDKAKVSGNLHQQSFSFTPPSGGNYALTCRAQHTGTGGSNLEDHITVTVLEPPPTPPVLRINGQTFNGSDNATVTVAREDLLNATCRVEGGHPSVTEIKLDCGFIDVSQRGNTLSRTDISIPRQTGSGHTCVCMAKHDSQCYTQNSRTVIIPPKEYDIIVNDTTPEKSVVEPGSKVEITCDVSGNHPDANLTLVSGYGQPEELQPSGNKTGVSIAVAQCKNSGRYICPGEDSGKISQGNYVDVFVECSITPPPRGSTGEEDVLTVTPTDDGNFDVKMKLLGYPDPVVTVKKEIEEGHYVILKDQEEFVDKSDRAKLPPPAVEVTIQLLDNHDEGTGRYKVTLDNKKGPPYEPTFKLKLSHKSGDEKHFLIAGIALGCAIAAIIATVFIVRRYRRRKQKKRQETEERNKTYNTPDDICKDDYDKGSGKGKGFIYEPPIVPSRDRRPSLQSNQYVDTFPSASPLPVSDLSHQSGRRPSLPESNTHKNPARRPSLPGNALNWISSKIPGWKSSRSHSADDTQGNSPSSGTLEDTQDGSASGSSGSRPSLPTTDSVNRLLSSSGVPSSGRRPSAPTVSLANEMSAPKTRRPSLPDHLGVSNPGVDPLVDDYLTPVTAKPTPLYNMSIQEEDAAEEDSSYVPFDPETDQNGKEDEYAKPDGSRLSDADINGLYLHVIPDDDKASEHDNSTKDDDDHDDDHDNNINGDDDDDNSVVLTLGGPNDFQLSSDS